MPIVIQNPSTGSDATFLETGSKVIIDVGIYGKSNGSLNAPLIDDVGRLHTRGFRDSAGDGRRMLVDSDRHGQVDILSLPAIVYESGLVVTRHKTYRLCEGLTFVAGSYFTNIPANGSRIMMVATGSTDLCINWSAITDGDAIGELSENVHVSNSGTQLPIYNRARDSTNTINTKIWNQPTITNSGLLIHSAFFFGGSGTGTKFVSPTVYAAGEDEDWRLANGSCYMVQVKNVCGRDMTLNFDCTMYERNCT